MSRTVLKLMLLSLKARKKAAEGYTLNTNMQIESNLLSKQINALEKEMKKWQKQ